MNNLHRAYSLLFLAASLTAHGQYLKTHGGSLAVGGTGQFSTLLTTNAGPVSTVVPTASGGVLTTTVSGQQQFTTTSAGFVTSLQFHPVSWAGVEFNYGFTHYSERYSFNYANTSATQSVSVPTDAHEATAAYGFHPRHIPFQPFVNIGGGAIDFAPRTASNQWRGAGLLETGFDIPTRSSHVGFRIEGRALVYRSPNFYSSALSTRSWRVTEQPSASVYYRF